MGDIIPTPHWFCIRHKPMISRVSIIMIQHLYDYHCKSIPISHPLYNNCTVIPMLIPASRYTHDAVIRSFMSFPHVGRKTLAAHHQSKKLKKDLPSATHYLLNFQQRIEHNYPITIIDHHWRKTMGSNQSEVMFALDCEMCTTAHGLELARVSVVDGAGDVVYDSFVVPDEPIINYNTEFSGITEETLKGWGDLGCFFPRCLVCFF